MHNLSVLIQRKCKIQLIVLIQQLPKIPAAITALERQPAVDHSEERLILYCQGLHRQGVQLDDPLEPLGVVIRQIHQFTAQRFP
ncbi:hypothetical protein D3C71_1654200 [compost metagenome]